MFDYIRVSASLEDRICEYVDHLHEHFIEPVRAGASRCVRRLADPDEQCVVRQAHYLCPQQPGYGVQMKPEVRTSRSGPRTDAPDPPRGPRYGRRCSRWIGMRIPTVRIGDRLRLYQRPTASRDGRDSTAARGRPWSASVSLPRSCIGPGQRGCRGTPCRKRAAADRR